MEAVDKAGGDEDYNEDGEWEYEYHETETEDIYITLDLTTHASPASTRPASALKRKRDTHDASARASGLLSGEPERNGASSSSAVAPRFSHRSISDLQILELHSKNPVVAIQDSVFKCEWASTIGTDILLVANGPSSGTKKPYTPLHSTAKYSVVAATRLRLVAKPAKLLPRYPTPTADPELPVSEEIQHLDRPEEHRAKLSSAEPQIDFLSRFAQLKKARGESDRPRKVIFRDGSEEAVQLTQSGNKRRRQRRQRRSPSPSPSSKFHAAASLDSLQSVVSRSGNAIPPATTGISYNSQQSAIPPTSILPRLDAARPPSSATNTRPIRTNTASLPQDRSLPQGANIQSSSASTPPQTPISSGDTPSALISNPPPNSSTGSTNPPPTQPDAAIRPYPSASAPPQNPSPERQGSAHPPTTPQSHQMSPTPSHGTSSNPRVQGKKAWWQKNYVILPPTQRPVRGKGSRGGRVRIAPPSLRGVTPRGSSSAASPNSAAVGTGQLGSTTLAQDRSMDNVASTSAVVEEPGTSVVDETPLTGDGVAPSLTPISGERPAAPSGPTPPPTPATGEKK